MPDNAEAVTQTVILARIFGFALIPFILSVIFGCTSCGNRRISWLLDLLAVGVGIGAFVVVQRVAETALWSAFAPLAHHWGSLAAGLIGLVAMAVALPLTYKVLYLRKPLELEEGPAH